MVITNQIPTAISQLVTYGPYDILINMVLALVLGLVISSVYRYTHKGLAYSQSFTLTIVFVAVITAIVMMVIGSSLARAFALVGAMSIIRFRTVVKDTKDTAYVFCALAVGLAAGTSNYFIAVAGGAFVAVMAVVLYKLNYGALYKSEFILRFTFDQQYGSAGYLEQIQSHSKRSNLLNIEPSGDGRYLSLTYDIALKEGATAEEFAKAMDQVEGTSEVVLIASKNDVDY
ncbi:MAG: DUF4956 domain-containing protein [Verrucomicrobia bacterium]|nr:DUF4956 domain-containing protein [Verrucomicrobiota bacterium]